MKLLKVLLVCAIIAFPIAAQTNHKVKQMSDLQCLTANLYFEARGEKPVGRQAVADVTLNRVQSKKFPKNVCAVVFQRKQFSWTHQVSWIKIDKILTGKVEDLRKADFSAYNNAKEIAMKSLGGFKILPEDSLHYHAKYVKPKWSYKMKKYATIGSHVFYRS